MSRISPFHFNINEYDEQELQNICPRYIKWLEKVTALDFSKRRKGKVERTLPSYDYNNRIGDYSKNPKKSKGFLSKIRKGGQNLRVRCRTSADLWRRWIRGGIMYNTELNEMDEQELEIQDTKTNGEIKSNKEIKPKEETKSKVEINIESSESKPVEESRSQEVTTIQDNKSDVKTDKSDTKIDELMVERIIDGNNANKNQIETKVQIERTDENINENTNDIHKQSEIDEKRETKEISESQPENETKPHRRQSKPDENVATTISDGINSTSNGHNSSNGMPEVVAND